MLLSRTPLLFAATLLAAAGARAEPTAIDEGAVVDAVEELMLHARDPVRVALPPIGGADVAGIEQALARALRARRREEIITPAYLRAQLRAQAEAQARAVEVAELKPFACDHVIFAAVVDEGGERALRLRLVYSESGEVLSEARARLGAGENTTATATSVRAAREDLAEQIAYALESRGVDVRAHRVAVAPLRGSAEAAEARLDRFVQAELAGALRGRGFLVVERARLDAVLDQAAFGQIVEDARAPELGRLLGANSIVLGAVDAAGSDFLVSTRVVDVESGAVVGGARAVLPRAGAVTLAAVETRTPFEAAVRSALAPGWGQAYNGHGAKALVFGVGGYGALATTLGLGIASGMTSAAYDSVRPVPGETTPEQAGRQARELFELRTGLLIATAAAGGVTAAVWGAGVVDALLGAPH